MPTAQQMVDSQDTLIRAVVYGPPRSKKTWWALKAAELGFNVHLFDADGGWEIAHQLDREALDRINVISLTDTDRPVSCFFFATLFKTRKLLWDEDAKLPQMVEKNVNHEHGHYYFDLSKLGKSDVVVIDSWTAIVASLFMRYFQETKLDLYEVDDDERNKRSEIGWTGALANHFLNKISGLPCHVVVIGHETTWEKRTQKVINGRKQEVIEDVRTQMVSTSGPNARDIIRRFGNALHFIIKLTGDIKINVKADPKEDAGSRLIAPGDYTWGDLSFERLCQEGHVHIPNGDQRSEGIVYLPANSDFTFEEIGLGHKTALPSAIKGNGSEQVATKVAVEKPVVKASPFAKAAN